ncbi:sensitivity to red-light reduced protein [Ranunculus cassubicifolius]
MSASTKCVKLTYTNEFEDWTIVTPRRGKHKKRVVPRIESMDEEPWVPNDLDIDPERESKLIQKMQACIARLEKSDFYTACLDQIQTPQVLDHISRILSSESKMQMVIYGIGSIDSYETPRLQLSLAILIKRRFDWIGDIEVFDPILSTTEIKVLEALGCSVLRINEQGRRQAFKPTMFFMPHCEAVLYDNLLKVNWQAEFLNQMVVFGNSFETYEQYISMSKNSIIEDSAKFILGARKFSVEVDSQLEVELQALMHTEA